MSTNDVPAASARTGLAPCRVADLCAYFLRLGTLGFGGPIALAGAMQRDLVETRRWIAPQEYRDGLALAQLAPGPLAAQLAMYLGWVRAGAGGAALVGVCFVLPSFAMVVALAMLYMRWGGVPGMRGAFYGIAAAVIALIARSVVKLARLTLARDVLLWSLAVTSALVTAWTESELAWLFVLSGAIALTVRIAQRRAPSTAALGLAWPLALVTGLHGPAAGGTLSRIAFYFTEAGAFVFGSGLAIVPFLHGGVVQRFGWLDDGQFLDAVAVAMVTPGPVVITVAFIGYLVAGFAGACVAALATFAPCYLFTVLPAPYFRRFGHDLRVRAFVDGVTAAATGAIAGAAFVLGRRALLDPPAVLLCLATLALLRYTKTPEAVAILAAGLFGVIWKGL